MVRLLVERSADRNAVDRTGYDALYFASLEGNIAIVKLLFEYGTDRMSSVSLNAALRAACSRGRLEVVRYLIERGADVNSADDTGRSPLALPIITGSTEVAALLIANKADVNYIYEGKLTGISVQSLPLRHR